MTVRASASRIGTTLEYPRWAQTIMVICWIAAVVLTLSAFAGWWAL